MDDRRHKIPFATVRTRAYTLSRMVGDAVARDLGSSTLGARLSENTTELWDSLAMEHGPTLTHIEEVETIADTMQQTFAILLKEAIDNSQKGK